MNNHELVTDVQAYVIGMLSIYPELFKSCYLKEIYFTAPFNVLFKAMQESMNKHNAIVTESMTKVKWFDIELYLRCCDTCMTSSVNKFNEYQRIVLDKYKIRALSHYSKLLSDGDITLDDFSKSYLKIMQLHTSQACRLTEEILRKSCVENTNAIWFSKFQKFGGALRMKEHDFMILAGGTGTGKSGVAVNLALDLANYYKIVYFNLEMVSEELYQRFISIRSNVKLNDLNKMKSLEQSTYDKVINEIKGISKRDITVVNGSQTIETMRSYVAGSITVNKHCIIIVDHVGLIGSTHKTSYERATEVAKELRKISLDYNCTIIGLCQLNRNALKDSKTPNLAMLRDSGELEQSASKVVFVWENDNEYSLVIEKNRSGKRAKINIGYDKETQLVYESSDQR